MSQITNDYLYDPNLIVKYKKGANCTIIKVILNNTNIGSGI